jgi:hypothetical protein
MQPFEAIGQMFTFLAFCLCGAKYRIKVFKLFFAVFAFVFPLLKRFLGTL